MKRRSLLFIAIFIFIFTFGFVTKVEAFCSSKSYNDLKATAYKATVSYELKFDSRNNAFFQLVVQNVDKDILVLFGGHYYEPVDGIVRIDTIVAGGNTYEVMLYGGYDTYCNQEYLYTKRITVPKYNKYSERDECIEYEEFALCNKWYSGYISGEDEFLDRLNEYIISLNKTEKEEKPVKTKSFFQKVIDFYTNNLIITLPITIIIILFIVYRIVVKIIRRKNRIKLNS